MWSLGGALDDVISARGQCVFNISNFNPFLPKVVCEFTNLLSSRKGWLVQEVEEVVQERDGGRIY